MGVEPEAMLRTSISTEKILKTSMKKSKKLWPCFDIYEHNIHTYLLVKIKSHKSKPRPNRAVEMAKLDMYKKNLPCTLMGFRVTWIMSKATMHCTVLAQL